jgi:hypothetical protein
VTPELDPERTEERFGFSEAAARRDYKRQNAQKPAGPSNPSQAVVPMPQGAATPAAPAPVTPDGGVHDGGPRRR